MCFTSTGGVMGSSAAAAEVPSSLRIPNVAAAVPLSDRQKCRRLRKEKKKISGRNFHTI